MMIDCPTTWSGFRAAWRDERRRRQAIEAFVAGDVSLLANLLPQDAVAMPGGELVAILRQRYGDAVDAALAPQNTALDAARADPALRGPVAHLQSSSWLQRANIVGVNVRTVDNFFNVVKYALTLPAIQDAIHLLPIWEPGVVGSLYGMCSWEINGELFSEELQQMAPHLDTAALQLRAVVNLLHLMGRAVGMDVVPHTDRYSEISLCYPQYFEWLRRDDLALIDHAERLHEQVQLQIFAFLSRLGPAIGGDPLPATVEALFTEIDEASRQRLLFGEPNDLQGRLARRVALVKHLHALGYEPVPATMAPPYRGLVVDDGVEAQRVDEHGMRWRDYAISQPQQMSRVFGPLARYKLYARLEDNADWEIDFDRPREAVWRYVCQHYGEAQQRFGFDFMRGDMSHVQMRPAGVPRQAGQRYDLLMAVKQYVQRDLQQPHFGYLAESFLAARDEMGYGDEVDHLEISEADAVIGNLQSYAVGDTEFSGQLRRYIDIGQTRRVSPALTVMTADKDDPRFDSFYLCGNELRTLLALFVPEHPSYTGLGFEVRDAHHEPAPNEHYTKLYVFQEKLGPKATNGPYVWGKNGELLGALRRIALLADALGPQLREARTRWLLPPDQTGANRVLAWALELGRRLYYFVGHVDGERYLTNVSLPHAAEGQPSPLRLVFSNAVAVPPGDINLRSNGHHYRLWRLGPAECRIYAMD